MKKILVLMAMITTFNIITGCSNVSRETTHEVKQETTQETRLDKADNWADYIEDSCNKDYMTTGIFITCHTYGDDEITLECIEKDKNLTSDQLDLLVKHGDYKWWIDFRAQMQDASRQYMEMIGDDIDHFEIKIMDADGDEFLLKIKDGMTEFDYLQTYYNIG